MKTVNAINNDGVHEISLYNVSGFWSNVKFSDCFKRKYIVIYKEIKQFIRTHLGVRQVFYKAVNREAVSFKECLLSERSLSPIRFSHSCFLFSFLTAGWQLCEEHQTWWNHMPGHKGGFIRWQGLVPFIFYVYVCLCIVPSWF